MGVPSAAQLHGLTDIVAAMTKAEIAGVAAAITAKTQLSLADTVDAFGDLDVEAALMPSALLLDRRGRPANLAAIVPQIAQASEYAGLLAAIQSQITAATGSTFAAYLVSSGAVLHPLVAEILRARGADPFNNNGSLVGVFAPNYMARAANHVYKGADGALVDITAAAASAATADMAIFTTSGHSVYIQSTQPFAGLTFGLSTLANVTIAPTITYWNGNAWVAVSGLSDASVGLTVADRISFTLPTDWEPNYKDAGGTAFPGGKEPLFTLKVTSGALPGTPPVGTCLNIVTTPVVNGTQHVAVDQPPLARGRITGDAAIAMEVLNAPDLTKFVAPAIRARAANALGANVTLGISYTNQAGANVTQAQSSWASPAALGTKALALNGADTGVNAILPTGWTVATTGGRGVFYVEVVELRVPAL